MAFCTQCGTIFHSDDMRLHVCDPADLPQKGEQRKPTTTKTNFAGDIIL